MLEKERQIRISSLLDERSFASVGDIAAETGSSEATVRRDLDKMQASGLLRRVRGGAQAIRTTGDAPVLGETALSIRNTRFREQKQKIAKYAAGLCSDGQLVFVDGGSTTFLMAPYLRTKNLKVVTNSFALAEAVVGSKSCTIILPGGVVYADSGLILNPFDEGIIGNFEADVVLLGAGAVTARGIENRDMRVIRAEREMLSHARKSVVLADSSKFAVTGSLLLCKLADIDTLITDSGIPETMRNTLQSAGIELVIV